MKAIVKSLMLVVAAALACGCTSTGNPWWVHSNSHYYTTPSGSFTSPAYPAPPPAPPATGAPDKVEGSQTPAVPGPTK
jgi:hypothetical protein